MISFMLSSLPPGKLGPSKPRSLLSPLESGNIHSPGMARVNSQWPGALGRVISAAFPRGTESQNSEISRRRVVTDEGQLRQALVNVIRNAVEAMPGGGSLTLAVRAEGDRAVIEVTDTGTGIPESFKARLFEPFATTKPRGTGLGLAFVQQVAQESGGDVWIESREGKGTSVRLRLRRA